MIVEDSIANVDIVDKNGKIIAVQLKIFTKTKWNEYPQLRNLWIDKNIFNKNTYKEDVQKDIEKHIKKGKFTFTVEIVPEDKMTLF